jgi:hypothetical protein
MPGDSCTNEIGTVSEFSPRLGVSASQSSFARTLPCLPPAQSSGSGVTPKQSVCQKASYAVDPREAVAADSARASGGPAGLETLARSC